MDRAVVEAHGREIQRKARSRAATRGAALLDSAGTELTSPLEDLILHPVATSSSAAALQRLNLNLPSEARDKLRSLAKTAGQPEGVYARKLLLSALARAEAAEFRRRLEASRSPARRERDRQIADALERLRG
jgi:hypothetical protein